MGVAEPSDLHPRWGETDELEVVDAGFAADDRVGEGEK